MHLSAVYISTLFLGLTRASPAPDISGMKILWQDNFAGDAGLGVNRDEWNIAGAALKTNGELQVYTDSTTNLRLSGNESVQLIPLDDGNGRWTSSRVETKRSWAPNDGKISIIQGDISTGSGGNKKGIWPAFWLLGDAIRHRTEWPLCGELDLLEQANGVMTGLGGAHCQQPSGGICQEPGGRHGITDIPTTGFHTWNIKWDRTTGNWLTERITWMRDGTSFFTLTGFDIGDERIWATLAHSPYYVLLNVAVGGTLPVSRLVFQIRGFGPAY